MSEKSNEIVAIPALLMAMTFRDDECRIRTENAPENVVTLQHMAVNLARRQKAKDSLASLSKAPHRTTTFSPT